MVDNVQEWSELCEYIKTNIMGYRADTILPEIMKISIKNALASIRLDNQGFSCRDMIMLCKKSLNNIQRCNEKNVYESELHRLNTALKCVKNMSYQLLEEKKLLMNDNKKDIPVVPICENDFELESKLFRKCGYDGDLRDKVRNSLIAAWCDGLIDIEGVVPYRE